MTDCPDTSTLSRFLDGGDITDTERVHIRICRSCQNRLDHLTDDDELRGWAAAKPSTNDTALSRLLHELTDEDRCLNDAPGVEALPFLEAAKRPGDLGALGHYFIESEIGRGGMGVVLRAVDSTLGLTVALKVLRPATDDPMARARLMREAKAAAQLRHPHIVHVDAVGQTAAGLPFLVMEYVAGPSLANVLRSGRSLDPRLAARWLAQVADALAFAHDAGVVHRDIKPSNILISGAPGSEVPKIADFGLARPDVDVTLTASGALAGTPAYMSPEQVRDPSRVDARSDVYSLGATLFECLTGDVPFRGSPARVLHQVLHDEPKTPRSLNESVPRDLDVICQKAMIKEPHRRYQSCRALAEDLRRFLNNEMILARPAGRLERTWRWCRRNPRVATLTGALAGLLLIVAFGSATAAMLIGRAYKQAGLDRDAAEKASEQAEKNFNLAVGSFNTLTQSVQSQIGTTPGLLPLKKKLLETAAAGLEQVVRGAAAAPQVDVAILNAHDRLGEIYLELGRTADAKAQFESLLRRAVTIEGSDADNVAAGRLAAKAHDQLGTMAYYGNDYASAAERYRQGQSIRRKLAAANPNDPKLRRDLAVSLGKIGDVHRLTGNALAAKEAYAEALQLTPLPTDGTANPGQMLFDLAFVHGRLFDAYLALGDLESAERHTKEALAFAEKRMAIEPAPGRSDVAYNVARLAQLALRRGEALAAVPHRRRVLELRRESARAEPESAAARRNVYLDLGLLGDALFFAADDAGARAAYDESRLACEAEVARDPKSLQKLIDLSICYERLMILDARAERFADAAAWAGKYVDLCRKSEADPRMAHLNPAATREIYQRKRAAYETASRIGLDDATYLEAQPPELRPTLFLLRAIKLARAGQHAEAAAIIEPLCKSANRDARQLFDLACCYGMCAKAVQSDSVQQHRYSGQAIALLNNALKLDASLLPLVPPHPDFSALRGQADFARLGR